MWTCHYDNSRTKPQPGAGYATHARAILITATSWSVMLITVTLGLWLDGCRLVAQGDERSQIRALGSFLHLPSITFWRDTSSDYRDYRKTMQGCPVLSYPRNPQVQQESRLKHKWFPSKFTAEYFKMSSFFFFIYCMSEFFYRQTIRRNCKKEIWCIKTSDESDSWIH